MPLVRCDEESVLLRWQSGDADCGASIEKLMPGRSFIGASIMLEELQTSKESGCVSLSSSGAPSISKVLVTGGEEETIGDCRSGSWCD